MTPGERALLLAVAEDLICMLGAESKSVSKLVRLASAVYSAQQAAPEAVEPRQLRVMFLGKLREAAQSSGLSWREIADLTDKFAIEIKEMVEAPDCNGTGLKTTEPQP